MDEAPPASISDLRFSGQFRQYQQTVLAGVETGLENDRYHIVAPPGSGKTILGLELVRRIGRRTIIFAPTTVIQRQWVQTLSAFLPPDVPIDRYAGSDPAAETPISVFTYQLIATPSAATEEMEALALTRWRDDLTESGVDGATDPEQRITEIREANPGTYAKELTRRRQAVRRELLRADAADVYGLLHPNAQALIDRLVAQGVGVVVLDECHHLLDYWAIVLRALTARLQDPQLIGLTATLPEPESEREYDNYIDLVGAVDFETPIPAVVREGHLAPYRDLVLFVEPTQRERAWLDNVADEFDRATDEVTRSSAYGSWFDARFAQPLPSLLEDDGPLLIAAIRHAAHGGRQLPATMLGARQLPNLASDSVPRLEDRIILLGTYLTEALDPSSEPADHELATRLRKILRAFGATVTERGIRRSRSPGDLLLAASDARIDGAGLILERELECLGSGDLRAVVVTDFDRDRSGVQIVDDVVGARAGGARRIAALLAQRPALAGHGLVLVTGTRVAVDPAHAAALEASVGAQAEARDLDLQLTLVPGDDGLVELDGSGPDWRPGNYVPMLTEAFITGVTGIIVGTRALLGEGWNAPPANVLIDLTSVASSQAVQQLRGRTMRLDPARPDKVAHNWDVVCIDARSEDGDPDLRRFVRRHEQLWAPIPPLGSGSDRTQTLALMTTSPAYFGVGQAVLNAAEEYVGSVQSGIQHVDPLLTLELAAVTSWTSAGFDRASRRSLEAIPQRAATRARWHIGSRFENQIRQGARLRPPHHAPLTTAAMERIAGQLLTTLALAVINGVFLWFWLAQYSGVSDSPAITVLLVAAMLGIVGALAYRPAKAVWQLAVNGAPHDEVLTDSARAVFTALVETGLIPAASPHSLRISDSEGGVVCWLESVTTASAELFAEAMQELYAPITDQRWLIERTDGRLPGWMRSSIVDGLRRVAHRKTGTAPRAFVAIPSALARTEQRRATFSDQWQRCVGGGAIVDGRSLAGALAAAQARTMSGSGRGTAEAWRSWS